MRKEYKAAKKSPTPSLGVKGKQSIAMIFTPLQLEDLLFELPGKLLIVKKLSCEKIINKR
jgi:hypothetical protein